MVAGVVFQPAAFGTGLGVAAMVGGVQSTRTTTVAMAEFPATSTAVPLTSCSVPALDATDRSETRLQS